MISRTDELKTASVRPITFLSIAFTSKVRHRIVEGRFCSDSLLEIRGLVSQAYPFMDCFHEAENRIVAFIRVVQHVRIPPGCVSYAHKIYDLL